MSTYETLAAKHRESVDDLRQRLGLFSFRGEDAREAAPGRLADLGLADAGVVEWLVGGPGAGAATCALDLMSRCLSDRKAWAIIDPSGEFYAPAISGWGLRPGQMLVVRPASAAEEWWAIEQCLSCPGVAATWAWPDRPVPSKVHRRWRLAAEKGGGVGIFFRPVSASSRPLWADTRLLATPLPGGQGGVRRIHIEVLYRQGGGARGSWVWEIDHAAGSVHLVPEVARPAFAGRATGA